MGAFPEGRCDCIGRGSFRKRLHLKRADAIPRQPGSVDASTATALMMRSSRVDPASMPDSPHETRRHPQ